MLEALSSLTSDLRFAEPLFEWANTQEQTDDTDDQARERIRDLLGVVPIDIDALIRMTNLSPGLVSHVLLELDLAGRLRREPGGKVALFPE